MENVNTQMETATKVIERLERDVVDMDLQEFREELGKLTVPMLLTMVEHIKGYNWDNIKHEGIRKMRLIMELKGAYFPDEVTTPKPVKPNPWKKIPTSVLLNAVRENNLEGYHECFNEGIRRMRLIMILKKAGITPDQL